MNKALRRRAQGVVGDLGPGIHPVLAQVYANRGIVSRDSLSLKLSRLLPPAQLLNLDRAAALLADCLQQGRSILFVGDFDADGATSTALGVSMLREMGAASVDYLVPNRFEYGYGLTPEIVELAAERSPHLIITVDKWHFQPRRC